MLTNGMQKIRQYWKNLTTPRLKVNELHSFWMNPTKKNLPECYHAMGEERSEALYQVVKRYVDVPANILELGCNVGRNLNCLFLKGYKNLTGVDINQKAISQLRDYYPALSASCRCVVSTIEDFIRSATEGSFDLVYTMAVLEHIHTDSEFVFEGISKIARKYIVTFEEEIAVSKRHFPRNYKKIFEPFGYDEKESFVYDPQRGEGALTVRVLEKIR